MASVGNSLIVISISGAPVTLSPQFQVLGEQLVFQPFMAARSNPLKGLEED